jgi:hypothetical protein
MRGSEEQSHKYLVFLKARISTAEHRVAVCLLLRESNSREGGRTEIIRTPNTPFIAAVEKRRRPEAHT